MRKLDFVIQTLLLMLAIFSVMLGFVIDKSLFVLIGVAQFLMGGWQLLSAFITSLNNSHGNTNRTKTIRIYWLTVVAYFIVLIPLCILEMELYGYIWFFSAWMIAIYYYVFTIQLTFGKYRERKTYLDIAN